MESLPGTYALILCAQQALTIPVSRLGTLQVQPGWYVYVGSAFGPGGIRARVGRHLHGGAALHWHIDYLRQVVPIVEVCYSLDPTPCEHGWAQALLHLPAAAVPLPGFGSSGCGCLAHLIYFEDLPALELISQTLKVSKTFRV